MPQTISITTGTIFKVALIAFGAWLLYELHDLVLIILTAVVIATAIEPGIAALMRRKIPRLLAVMFIYVVLISSFRCLFYFFVPSVLTDTATFVSALPSYLDVFTRVGAFDELGRIVGIEDPVDTTAAYTMDQIRNFLGGSGGFGNALGAATGIFGGVFSFFLIIIFSFYLAVIEKGVDDFLRVVTPRAYEGYMLDLWRRSHHKIGLWMQGQLLLGLIIGVLVYLGLTILGVKHALLLAILAALFELIPVFGPILAAVPAVLIGFVEGGFSLGILVIALYLILQQFENHLIYPLVVTKVVGVPPLLVILALIIGAQLAGFLGILLSVPVAATLQELIKDIEQRRAFAQEA